MRRCISYLGHSNYVVIAFGGGVLAGAQREEASVTFHILMRMSVKPLCIFAAVSLEDTLLSMYIALDRFYLNKAARERCIAVSTILVPSLEKKLVQKNSNK